MNIPFMAYYRSVCVTKFLTTNRCEIQSRDTIFSPGPVNTVRSGYRVLRAAMGRPIPRSVNREQAGRNAKSEDFSVKRLSPDKHNRLWWPSQYEEAKATPVVSVQPVQRTGTTGVREHGMSVRLLRERKRSLEGRAGLLKLVRQNLNAKSAITPIREVRCLHSSCEVG